MLSTRIRRRIYPQIAIALVTAIIAGVVAPPGAWVASWLNVPVAQAAPLAAVNELPSAASPGIAPSLELEALDLRNVLAARGSVIEQPLSISRVQSAYSAADVISGALVVTFTVTNDHPPAFRPNLTATATLTEAVAAMQALEARPDPNLVRNVLLADSLTEHATLVSAMPRPQQRGSEYAWNLGDLAPLESITVTLVLSTPETVTDILALDNGARAWGTFQERAVNARACPLTLAPDTLGGETLGSYLRASVEANPHDEYVIKQAGQLCQPGSAFEYVRQLDYEAYKGSLRGARGTLWSKAGNSLDQSSLLIAMLRGNGVPARYRHGALSVASARELILSMFPTTGAIVGYVPESVEVSDPANDAQLLAEAQDHWWVEAFVDGSWVAMDPTFKHATPGQTFTTPEGPPLDTVPDALRHKVTVTVEAEGYDMLTYLYAGFVYQEPLTYTFNTVDLVGEPLTLEHLVASETPPLGCMIFCWTHYTYAPYLRLGDNATIIQGHSFWELLSNYPFGQFAITAEWLHFDVQDADGNVTRYTRSIADRVAAGPREGPLRGPKMVKSLMTADVLSSLGPGTPSLVHPFDTHTIYFNPAWMSPEYAANVGDELLVAAPRILKARSIALGLGDLESVLAGERPEVGGAIETAEVADTVDGTLQAFNRMLGASFVTFSDDASQDLADTGLVRAYPDTPRITIASTMIAQSQNISETAQVQILDLLHDGVRVIAYPGQARGAERVYRTTRGVNDTFIESLVGDELTGQHSASAANILQAAPAQGVPLVYVDAARLDVLNRIEISTQAKAYILDAVQRGYGIFVPERMIQWGDGQTIAWWQLNLETGEMIGVGENGTHQWLVILTGSLRFLVHMIHLFFMIVEFVSRFYVWHWTAITTWTYFWRQVLTEDLPADAAGRQQIYEQALKKTKEYMRNTVWPQLAQRWEDTGLSNLVPVEDIQ